MAKILYAEDDEDLSNMVTQWLSLESHDVDKVESGTEALEHLEFCSYDILLLDWNLRGMNGIKVCEIFRAIDKSTPVIMLTGSRGKEIRESGFKAGATRIFHKPPDLKAVCSCIEELLSKKTKVCDFSSE